MAGLCCSAMPPRECYSIILILAILYALVSNAGLVIAAPGEPVSSENQRFATVYPDIFARTIDSIALFLGFFGFGLRVLGRRLELGAATLASLVLAALIALFLKAHTGFVLDQLPPLLVVLIMLSSGLAWYLASSHILGYPRPLATATAYTTGYGIMLVAMPRVTDSFAQGHPVVWVISLIGFSVAVTYLVIGVCKKTWPPCENASMPANSTARVGTSDSHLCYDSQVLHAMLMEAQRNLKTNPKQAKAGIQSVLTGLVGAMRQVEGDLERLRILHRATRRDYVAASQDDRREFQLRALTRRVALNTDAFERSLYLALRAIEREHPQEALRHLKKTRHAEQMARRLSKSMGSLASLYRERAARAHVRAALAGGRR